MIEVFGMIVMSSFVATACGDRHLIDAVAALGASILICRLR